MKEKEFAMQCNSHEQSGVSNSSDACFIDNHHDSGEDVEFYYDDDFEDYSINKKSLVIAGIVTVATIILSISAFIFFKKRKNRRNLEKAKKEFIAAANYNNLLERVKKLEVVDNIKNNSIVNRVMNYPYKDTIKSSCIYKKLKSYFE